MKLRAAIIGLALAPCFLAGAVRADTGPGPAPGNSLNRAPVNPSTAGRWMFEEGMGTRSPSARSPIGRLYDIPLDPGEEAEDKPPGWISSAYVELGGLMLRGDDRSAWFRNYQDFSDGLYLNIFALSAAKPSEARYVEATGGGAGRDDQFYRFQAGRYNDWKVSAFFDGTPQVFTSSYKSLWDGLGSANPRLIGLKPGGTTNAATTATNIRAALAATPDSSLEVQRDKAGIRVDKVLGEHWKLYAGFTDEKRTGARPFGAVFGGGGGGGNFEIAESIDYRTSDFVAGAQFSDALSSFNLRAAASFFRNDIDTMSFENPLYISLNGISGVSPATFTHGRLDLAPDNEHYNVKGEYSRALPAFHRGNFTATVALGSMRQDDALVAPTDYELTGGTVTAGGASLASFWNTPEALSRQSAGMRLDTRLADFGLSLKPASALDVKGKLRYYETRNTSQYLACNPLTGQWGRLLNNGSGVSLVGAHTGSRVNPAGTSANAFNAAGCDLDAVRALNLVPSAGHIPIGAVPTDYRQLTASLAGDYRLGRASSVNASLERDSFRRERRERAETWEDRFKVAYVDRGTIEGTMRLSYEHARRGGGEYDHNAYQPFTSASFGPTPTANNAAVQTWLHGIDQFRSFDLADRKHHLLKGRIDYAFTPNFDGAVTLQAKDAKYLAEYGRTGHQRSSSATFDLSYQAGPHAVLYGFYSFQSETMRQRGVDSFSCILNYTYYFYSDGQVRTTAVGATPPAAPAGTTLLATRDVGAGNWRDACGTASPTSPLLPESRGWDVASRDRHHVIGFGLKYDFGKVRLDTSYTRSLGRTRIGYRYNAAALELSAEEAALAGDGLSDLTFAQNIFDASVLFPLNRNVTMRFLVRHEAGRIRDWHYDGLASIMMPTNNAAYLDAGPQDYRATLVGIFFQVRM